MKPLKSITFVCLASLCLLAVAGCDSLRFAPTEPQKEIAELTHGLAVKINAEGAAPGSPASQKLWDGTAAAASYMGRPKVPPDPDKFETIAAQANTDAAARPVADDVFAAADKGLSLAAELAILFGVGGTGFAGKKLIDWVALARAKNKALSEIIKGNELFKKRLLDVKTEDITAAQAWIEEFKEAQDEAQKSLTTKTFVTEIKNS